MGRIDAAATIRSRRVSFSHYTIPHRRLSPRRASPRNAARPQWHRSCSSQSNEFGLPLKTSAGHQLARPMFRNGVHMNTRSGRNFVALLLGVVLSLGSLVWISGGRSKASPVDAQAVAQSTANYQPRGDESVSSASQVNDSNVARSSDDCYAAGYRDGWRDAAGSRTSAVATSRVRYSRSSYSAPRRRVAGATYYAERRQGHSTRNAILTIAAPAALGAGIGAIAGGKRGAGAGALIGGGGGALYYLLKHRR